MCGAKGKVTNMETQTVRTIVVSAAAAALLLNTAQLIAGQLTVWAVGENVRVNPETGRAFEDNPRTLPGCFTGDYRSANSAWSGKDKTVHLAGGRNEVVAFQLILEGQAKRVVVDASPLAGAASATIDRKQLKLFREWYIWIDGKRGTEKDRACMAPLGAGWYPDVAIPLSEPKYGSGFSIPSKDFHDPAGTRFCDQKNQAVWVDLHIPADAAPGDYTGQITVDADGAKTSVNLRLHVWSFVVPPTFNMQAELMNYGETSREPDPKVMYEYFRLAHEHRLVISDDKVKPPYDPAKGYDWKEFDARFGPLFDGSVLAEGPCAGTPIPYWTLPITYQVDRPDKTKKRTGRDWPVLAPKTPSNCGVQFTDAFKKEMGQALKRWEAHFVKRGWTRTVHGVFQNCLDEPGFHKSGKGLEAGKEQGAAIYETARLIKDNGLKLVIYKLDIGSGFRDNKLDLDGNGKAEGPRDVANYLAPVVDMFSIHGLCIDLDALEPHMKRLGTKVIFYNGYHPRIGPNTIHGEMIGLRTWGVAAWRSGLSGWADWQFRRETNNKIFYETNDAVGRTLYVYRGDHIGLPGKVFASLRLKSMRRGAQDYEMLRLLAARDGHDRRAQALAAAVCGAGFKEVKVDIKDLQDDAVGIDKPYAGVDPNAHWSHDVEAWEKFRRALGEALNGKK